MPSVTISQQELLDALAAATQAPEDAMTAEEIAAFANCSTGKVHQCLKAFARDGRLQLHQTIRRRIDGRAQKVPAYSIVPAKKAKK
jgi:hypothetical protein